MLIKQDGDFAYGYTAITERNGKFSEMLMDFGILMMKDGDEFNSDENLERTFLLIRGEAQLSWNGITQKIKRDSFLDESPWVLNIPAKMNITISCERDKTEFSIIKVENETSFTPVLYKPEDCKSAQFGEGTMREASTRTVRTVFDRDSAPWSGHVLGEVINHPGKWSSYPPHDHTEPEVYHYRMYPSQGFGFSMEEDKAHVVKNNYTCAIPGDLVHSQCSAPGYAMYYIWVIPHMKDHAKWGRDTTTFRDEHKWVMDSDAEIWPPENK